ncbi:hypothetical protein EON68_00870 [archaeon]|nr:MAG: hypothetical protein EON68_00870 [archaeon]
MQAESGRLLLASSTKRLDRALPSSPLFVRRLLWCVQRVAATYSHMDLSLYHGQPMSDALLSYLSTQRDAVDRAPDAYRTPTALQVVPCASGTLGGRPVLELMLQLSSVALAVWGSSEPEVAEQANLTLLTLTATRNIARYCTVSPTFAALASQLGAVCAGAGRDITAVAVRVGGWTSVFSLLDTAPEAVLQHTLTAVLLAARHVGWEEDVDVMDSGARRWSCRAADFFKSFTDVLAARLASVLGSADFAAHASRPHVVREVERMFALHTSLLAADATLPSAWHLPATLPAFAATTRVIESCGATGSLCMAAMRYARRFLDCDLYNLDPTTAQHIFRHVTCLFKVYTGAASVPARAGAGGVAEEEMYEDIVALLSILRSVIRQADIASVLDSAGGSDSGSGSEEVLIADAASEAVSTGLAFLVPVMTTDLLRYETLAVAYIDVVSDLVVSHPQHVARLAPAQFEQLVSSLLFGIEHTNEGIVQTCLLAIKSLGEYHAACMARPAAALPRGLDAQLPPTYTLFKRLTYAVLKLMLGSTPPLRTLLPTVAETVQGLMAADPTARDAALAQLSAELPDDSTRARVATQAQALSATEAAVAPQLRERSSRKAARGIMVAAFETFVTNVRSIITIR